MLDACKSGDLRSATAVLKMGLKPNRPLNVRFHDAGCNALLRCAAARRAVASGA
jgi:hypothetical protein